MDPTTPAHEGCINLARHRMEKTDSFVHAETRALFNYWEQLRDGRLVPKRAEVNPRDMRCNVRNLFILEDVGGGNIRFRLAGTEIVDALGLELRGLPVRSIMADDGRESIVALLREAFAEPGIGHLRLRPAGFPQEVWEAVLLPLRGDSGHIDRMLGCLVRIDGIDRIGEPSPSRFVIEEASILPIRPTRDDDRPLASGFSETPARYEADGSEPGDAQFLRAIEGGMSDKRDPGKPRDNGRPNLRLVKGD